MTSTAPEKAAKRSARSAEQPPAARPAAVGQPTKSRRRTWMIALGIALVIIGGLFTWYVTTNTSRTVSVLTTSKDIERGQEITQQDLTTITLAGGQNADAVTAKDATDVIGKVAAVDLPAGSLLTTNNVIDTLPVPSGDSIVGIALSANQLPAYALKAGDKVRLVDTPVAQGEPPTSDPQTFNATVFTTRYDEKNQVTVVDVVVPEREAAAIAARAATQRVSLVLDSVGG